MIDLINVAKADQKPVWINPQHVRILQTARDGRIQIMMDGTSDVYVALTMDETVALLQGRPKGYSIFRDDNRWCAVGPKFVNLQESHVGFGLTPTAALAHLIRVEES